MTALNNSLINIMISCLTFAGAAHAVDSQTYTINLTATVPSHAFQLLPVDNHWVNETQDMGYDISTSRLQVFEKLFQYKNTAGGIQARLVGNLNADNKPQLSNGVDTIPLLVTFNGVALSNKATTVVTTDAAKAGGRSMLKISQADKSALTVHGLFTGGVAMIFEPDFAE